MRRTAQSNPMSMATAERRATVSRLRATGMTLERIADQVGVSTSTVAEDCRQAQELWLEAARQNRQIWIAQELENLDVIQREALQEWLRSRQPAQEIRKENDSGAAGGTPRTKTTRSRRGRVGDSRLLAVILKCVEQRRALLGLDAPQATAADLDRELAEPTIIEVTTRDAARLVMESSEGRLLVRVSDQAATNPGSVLSRVTR